MSGKERAAKILAIIVFSLTMSILLATIISDVALFAEQIMSFIVACIGSAFAWFFGLITVIVSIAFIFGILLLEQYGFWPNTFAAQVFHETMADAAITQQQLQILKGIRLAFFIVYITTFIGAIVCLAMRKSVKKEDPSRRQSLTTTFGVISLVFSILGFATAGFILCIF